MTVYPDLDSTKAVKQVLQTGLDCRNHLIQTLTGCTGDVILGVAGKLSGASLATSIALTVVLSLLKSL